MSEMMRPMAKSGHSGCCRHTNGGGELVADADVVGVVVAVLVCAPAG